MRAKIRNHTKGTVVAARARIADSFVGRLVGLLGHTAVQSGGGMWLVPSNSVHTIGMLFAIDVVMLSENGRVVGFRERVRPFSIVWPIFRARSVLELPANTVSATRTEVGDQLQIEIVELPESD
jgi:uncharacterized protein